MQAKDFSLLFFPFLLFFFYSKVFLQAWVPCLPEFNYTFSNYCLFVGQKIPVFCRLIFPPQLICYLSLSFTLSLCWNYTGVGLLGWLQPAQKPCSMEYLPTLRLYLGSICVAAQSSFPPIHSTAAPAWIINL